ncbi:MULTISPECIES: Hpt domain-containing protein [Pseudomonas]|uniref:Hpt domain-containing protein n=1 Tax=Pseudomonas protegens TaxID=380021 RepID=A0A7G8YT17_9PSED|nr:MULTISPECIES: Hpt domain-containing protein [Pseudomonas]RBJ80458.1 Hpt domain-containing protein [Pseudomonas sp. MWU12-2534b]MCO7568688.1 Hpt domain-containing protein [Pseudomonas chlororaphis]MCO7588531.1 Hpt domain-containing protein [Pseudomonas chlororaphis]MDF2394495.1 Hpt domain-containing protein [Pseudomonas sp. 3MA1]MDP9525146.1 Hpt domain-containing protein [Pseudomonas protegens]
MAEIHLDHTVLNALQEVMEDEYPVLLDTFVCDSEERVRLLHKSEDALQLVATAHSLKGSSSNMGAIRLAELCHELELRAGQSATDGIARLVGEIDGEFAIVRRLCEQELQRFHC